MGSRGDAEKIVQQRCRWTSFLRKGDPSQACKPLANEQRSHWSMPVFERAAKPTNSRQPAKGCSGSGSNCYDVPLPNEG
jgi:hypothetical protein